MRCYDKGFCSSPIEVERILKLRSVQIGANAYIKCFWEKKSERTEYTYVKGYSKNGRPYYGTEYFYDRWFTGYCIAVIAEPIMSKNNLSLNK